MTHSTPPAPGRRTANRARGTGIDLTTVLAVVLPIVCALALLAVKPGDVPDEQHPPTRTTLTSSTLVCPSALPDAPTIGLTTTARDVAGQVTVGLGKDPKPADVATDTVTTLDDPDALAVTGEDETAPGLAASRFGGDELAVAGCLPPAAHEWFTGVGAGAGHTSVLELTNPDAGTAVADVTVLSGAGVVDAPQLRGISVPGASSIQLDLGKILPRRGDLALEVVTARGRVGADVLDRVDRVGSSPLTQDWLPSQADPARTNLLMGLADGAGRRSVVIANGGPDEVRAEIKIVSEDSVFSPKGLDEVRIPPQSVVRVTVSSVIAEAIKDGALGLQVTASEPVTATLRSQVGKDLSHAVSGVPVTGAATAVLPGGVAKGPKATKVSVVLAGATRTGTVTVVSRAADGSELDRTTVDVTPGRGFTIPVPAAAVQLTVTPAKAAVTGSVLVTRQGSTAVLPLTVPVTSGLVPDVRPGLS
ncbi:DUF5719 family protein [Nocardioides sp. CN2-186]|uniref:DUF5719 family protein n=1 Tax=Nocardioides tweenelious TaxID=3156607 RepID=UPI0032B3B83D